MCDRGGFEKQRPCEAGEAISPVGLCVASIFRFSKNASGRIFWVYYNFYWRSFWNTWIKPKPLGLSVISYAFNFVLVMYHIWINRIFIGKVVGAHMKFYMYPLCRCNFSGDSYPILQKFCLFVVRNHCQPNDDTCKHPRQYRSCPNTRLTSTQRYDCRYKNSDIRECMNEVL